MEKSLLHIVKSIQYLGVGGGGVKGERVLWLNVKVFESQFQAVWTHHVVAAMAREAGWCVQNDSILVFN